MSKPVRYLRGTLVVVVQLAAIALVIASIYAFFRSLVSNWDFAFVLFGTGVLSIWGWAVYFVAWASRAKHREPKPFPGLERFLKPQAEAAVRSALLGSIQLFSLVVFAVFVYVAIRVRAVLDSGGYGFVCLAVGLVAMWAWIVRFARWAYRKDEWLGGGTYKLLASLYVFAPAVAIVVIILWVVFR
ncbi:MAG: hypothetical protein JXA57_08595 [Armatimonadetes bacterium]|nr:hypothetical protein [Armatimonadota bacterium]